MTKEEAIEVISQDIPCEIDMDLIEALNMAIEALSAEPQGFEDYLNQYLGENDQMLIGKDVYEELKYEADEYEELMRQYKHLRKYASDLETKLSAEPQDSADRERVIALRVNNKTCVQCKYYECFDRKEFPCIDCMLDCKDRFEPKPVEQTEWISVKEHGNPKEDGLYMVTARGGFEETENDYVTTSHYIFDRGGWSVEDVDTEVTAWMPKPSPYKGE